jgi:hypothetical protein
VSNTKSTEKQVEYMDPADKAKKIIVAQVRSKVSVVTSISCDDLYFSKQMVAKIGTSIQESKEGKLLK